MSSLYRKYRPQHFHDLIGQDHIRDILIAALDQSRAPHACLFTGPRGTGKTSTARIFARSLVCTSQESRPCNTCELCLESLSDRLPDIIEIDAASHGLVDDARDLVEKSRFHPLRASKKIYIIDEVHMLSKSAFNALLKILEEPPAHVHFILATTEAHKVPDTIRSRCLRFDFRLADEELLYTVLEKVSTAEGLTPAQDALRLVAQHAEGSFRDALSLLEQMVSLGDFSLDQVRDSLGISENATVDAFIDALLRQDRDSSFQILRQLEGDGDDVVEFVHSLLHSIRSRMHSTSATLLTPLLHLTEELFRLLPQVKSALIPLLPLELLVYRTTTKSAPDLTSPHITPSLSTSHPTDLVSPDTPPLQIPQSADIPISDVSRTSEFVPQEYIRRVKHASLRSLLKFSEVKYLGETLEICANSPFEQDKLLQQENHVHLTEILRQYTSSQATVVVKLKTASGLTSQDILQSFS